jgi:hypothetical protein
LVWKMWRKMKSITSYCPADEPYIRSEAVSDWSWNTCFKLDLRKEKANDWVLILKKAESR